MNIILPSAIYCEWTHLLRWWANDYYYYYGAGPLVIYVSIFRATHTLLPLCSSFVMKHTVLLSEVLLWVKKYLHGLRRSKSVGRRSNKSWKEFFHLFLFDIILLHCFYSWPGAWLAVTFSLLIYYFRSSLKTSNKYFRAAVLLLRIKANPCWIHLKKNQFPREEKKRVSSSTLLRIFRRGLLKWKV